jgi:hypothetical protein
MAVSNIGGLVNIITAQTCTLVELSTTLRAIGLLARMSARTYPSDGPVGVPLLPASQQPWVSTVKRKQCRCFDVFVQYGEAFLVDHRSCLHNQRESAYSVVEIVSDARDGTHTLTSCAMSRGKKSGCAAVQGTPRQQFRFFMSDPALPAMGIIFETVCV